MEWLWNLSDEGRVKRARSVKFSEIDLTSDHLSGRALGSASDDYFVTLDGCTCADFSISGRKGTPVPCKHMIALAMKAGIINENGNTPTQQRTADIESLRSRIAAAYGFYHLFSDPIMSDAEYDKLKDKLAELQKEKNV